jgi:hypothetical protein
MLGEETTKIGYSVLSANLTPLPHDDNSKQNDANDEEALYKIIFSK